MTAKLLTALGAAALIPDGATVAVTGAGGGLLEPEAVLAGIEQHFLTHGAPRGLTVLHAQGLGNGSDGGLSHLAHEGLVARVIGAHWTWSPRMQALAAQEKIAAYALPGGTIQHLLREIGARRPGLFTRIGLDTFVDPRLGGGRMNASAHAPLSQIMTIGGENIIHYPPFPLDVAVIRASRADARGNLAFDDEGAELDALVLAMAAHNLGGRVIAQVREIVAVGSLPPRSVRVPAALVDALVLAPEQRWSHLGDRAEAIAASPESTALPPERQAIAARAYRELKPGMVASFGFGIPDGIARMARNSGLLADLHSTLDHGHHGGVSLQGALFGFVPDGEAMIDSPSQFDFYSGGGLDIAFLGFGEIDALGSVNVSRLGGRIIGPGGFIDIAQEAKSVVFCGTFEANTRQGTVAKFVEQVEQITFSGPRAARHGQSVLYVTERAVFRRVAEGLLLEEIAPGVDLERDVLARMRFRPLMR